MSDSRSKRVSAIEQDLIPRICNCRIATLFHNANCLRAILKVQCIPCPAHDFRFLGVFFPVQTTELVLSSDRQFCTCLSPTESETEDAFESASEALRREFRAQTKLMAEYFRSPVKKYRLENSHAAILSRARTDENGNSDVESFASEDLEVLKLALDYHRKRVKWMVDTGQPLPTSFEILKLNMGRFYPNAGTM